MMKYWKEAGVLQLLQKLYPQQMFKVCKLSINLLLVFTQTSRSFCYNYVYYYLSDCTLLNYCSYHVKK